MNETTATETTGMPEAREPLSLLLKLDCEPTLVPARGSGQMICKVPCRTEVVSLELFGGPTEEPPPQDVRVIRVGVGARMFPANVNGHDVGRWEECYGQIAPAESWLLISLQNEGAEPLAVGGRFTTRPDLGVKGEASSPQQTSSVAGTASFQQPEVQRPALPAQSQQVPQVSALRAGANEVAVFLTREACRRLVESLMGSGPVITAYEKNDIVRRLSSAMVVP